MAIGHPPVFIRKGFFLSLICLLTLISHQNCSNPLQTKPDPVVASSLGYSESLNEGSNVKVMQTVETLAKSNEEMDTLQAEERTLGNGASFYSVDVIENRLQAYIDQPGEYVLVVNTKMKESNTKLTDLFDSLNSFKDSTQNYTGIVLTSNESKNEFWSLLSPLNTSLPKVSAKIAAPETLTFKFQQPSAFSMEAPALNDSRLVELQRFFLINTETRSPLKPVQSDNTKAPAVETKSFSFRINAGGDDVVTDTQRWASDAFYIARQGASDRGNLKISGSVNIPLKVYQTEAWCVDSYKIPVKNGNFEVELHFAETSEKVSAAGQRVFDVDVEGHKYTDLDIFRLAGGKQKAFVVASKIKVEDETINIKFSKKTNCPMLLANAQI